MELALRAITKAQLRKFRMTRLLKNTTLAENIAALHYEGVTN